MTGFLSDSAFFGVTLSLLSYGLGLFIHKKTGIAVFHPLLLSILFTIAVLAIGRIDYDIYYSGAKYLSWLLTPATVCLAVPLYENPIGKPLLRESFQVFLPVFCACF